MNKIQAMFIGYLRLSEARKHELDPLLLEQAAFRANECQSCVKNKQCAKCHCDLPAMFFVDKDHSQCPWPTLMDHQQWEQYKSENNIQPESLIKNFNQILF